MKYKRMHGKILCVSILIVQLFFIAKSAIAGTEVGGNIAEDTTWTKQNSPYIVTSTAQVLGGVKLTIEPGVTAKFNQDTGLTIGGELNAIGSPDNMIEFTSSQSNLASEPAGLWNGIKFIDSSTDAQLNDHNLYLSGSIIKYCKVEYAGGGYQEIAISINNCSPIITNNIITHNSGGTGGGIYINYCSPIIKNNRITGNSATLGGGIYVDQSYYFSPT